MKRLGLVVLLAAAGCALPGAARGAACSPLSCSPSQFSLGHGLMGFRTAVNKPVTVVDLRTGARRWTLPWGLTGGSLLVHQEGHTLSWWSAVEGRRLWTLSLPGAEYSLVGVSQSGGRAVAMRYTRRGIRVAVVSRGARRTFTLATNRWEFDALRGNNLILIHPMATGGYQVRLFDLASNRLVKQPLKDPHSSATIWGSPFSRISSADGRYLFTLYIGSNGGSMIHELDLRKATARCIDLPGTGNYDWANTWGVTLSRDGSTLWAASPGYGRAVAIDVHAAKVKAAFRIDLPYWNTGDTTNAALSPDGTRLALANGNQVAVVSIGERKVVRRRSSRAIAVGYSPDGARLWKLR